MPRVHKIVMAPDRTALLVMDLVEGTSLEMLPADQLTDDLLRRLWSAVRELHRAQIAHRSLRTGNVMVDLAGAPLLGDFSFAEHSATRRQQDLDVAELLASLAIQVGPDRAVSCAIPVLGADRVAAAAPLLQPMALSAATRRAIARQKGLLDRTRAEATAQAGHSDPELAKVQRVRPRTLLTIAAASAAFYILLPQLAQAAGSWRVVIRADWAWIAAVIAASALTYCWLPTPTARPRSATTLGDELTRRPQNRPTHRPILPRAVRATLSRCRDTWADRGNARRGAHRTVATTDRRRVWARWNRSRSNAHNAA